MSNTYKYIISHLPAPQIEACEREMLAYLDLLKDFPDTLFPESAYFVIDYPAKKYLLLKGNIRHTAGYPLNDFACGGIAFFLDKIHPADFKIFNDLIFPNFVTQIAKIQPVQLRNYTFSWNYRVKAENGAYHSVVQRGRYIADPHSGKPIYCYGTLENLDDYLSGHTIRATVDHTDPHTNRINRLVSELYYPDLDLIKLSAREMEILRYITEGLTNRELAEKFSISENTVSNHRINIMQKTQVKNTAQLTRFALEKGLI